MDLPDPRYFWAEGRTTIGGNAVELRHYASIIRRWLWLILLGTVVAGGAGYLVSSGQPPAYEASSILLINSTQDPNSAAYTDIGARQQLAKTYSELILKRPILKAAMDRLNLSYTPDDLVKDRMISVQPVRDTMLLQLKAKSSDPQEAAESPTPSQPSS